MKVLSIDFDITMWPVIKMYNELCNTKFSWKAQWAALQESRGINDWVFYDPATLKYIARILGDANHVHVCKRHQTVGHDLIYRCQQIDKLVNIDWHHDIIYPDQPVFNEDLHAFNDGNWLGHLMHRGIVKEATWVTSVDAEPIVPQLHYDGMLGRYNLSILESLDVSEYAYVYFCKSENWVPPKYHHLFDTIVNTLGKGRATILND